MQALTEAVLKQIKDCNLCIIQDDAAPDKRACLVSPSTNTNEELLNRLLTISNSLVHIAIDQQRAEAFMLTTMPALGDKSHNETSALVSVDAREGISTGISVTDRVKAVQILGAAKPDPQALVKPGHVFPIKTTPGGLLVKNAMPEAALDLAQLAWSESAAVFMYCLNNQGQLLGESEQQLLSTQENIPLILVSQLTLHRLQNEKLVERVAETKIPSRNGITFKAFGYRSKLFAGEHLALVKGELTDAPILTRVHAEQTFNDVFGGSPGNSREQLQNSMAAINKAESGVILYLKKAGTGALSSQLTKQQNQITSRTNLLMREYGIGAQILKDLGIRQIRLLSNSRPRLIGLDNFGINIVGYEAT